MGELKGVEVDILILNNRIIRKNTHCKMAKVFLILFFLVVMNDIIHQDNYWQAEAEKKCAKEFLKNLKSALRKITNNWEAQNKGNITRKEIPEEKPPKDLLRKEVSQ